MVCAAILFGFDSSGVVLDWAFFVLLANNRRNFDSNFDALLDMAMAISHSLMSTTIYSSSYMRRSAPHHDAFG